MCVLSKSLLATVFIYAEHDPIEIFLCKETTTDVGLKMFRVNREINFDFQKIEEAFRRMISFGTEFDCKQELLHQFNELLLQPTYHVYSRFYCRFAAVNINLFDFVENPAPQEEPALPRLRELFRTNSVARKALVRETVLVEENYEDTIRTVKVWA